MADDDLPFHTWLQRLRQRRDLTQELLAKRAGCAVSTLRKLEQGSLRPSRELAATLARALDVPADEVEAFVRRARMTAPAPLPQPPQLQAAGLCFGTSLPFPATPLLGRQEELTALVELLCDPAMRLLTLTGPGGVGKTRVALQLAEQLLHTGATQPQVVFVPLAALRDPALLHDEIARALQLREHGVRGLREELIARLGAQPTLLILDNVEQLREVAPLIAHLLHACRELCILATSRVALGVYGERLFPLAPLSLPAPGADAAIVAANPACALFVQRAQAVSPAFRLTATNAETVVTICRRLDGLPLAIELAAARLRLFPLDGLLARMERRLDLLTAGPRTSDPRQQTLRGTIAWSYQLLDPTARLLLARLAVFVGGAALPAVEAICTDEQLPPGALIDALDSLIAGSLLRQRDDQSDEARFDMLEVLREFAGEQLAAAGERETLRRRHASFYGSLAERAERELLGPEQVGWLDHLEREHENLRAALQWALAEAPPELALTWAAALARFWWLRGHLSEGRRWLQFALTRPTGASSVARARALYWAGILAIHQGDYPAAETALVEGHEWYETAGEQGGVALALNALGVIDNRQGNHTRARACYEQSLAIARERGDSERIATGLNNLGYTLLLLGQFAAAGKALRTSLALARQVEDTQGEAFALTNLGLLALRQGRTQRARSLLAAGLCQFSTLGDLRNSAEALEGLAEVATAERQGIEAAELLGAAAAYRETVGAPLAPHAKERLQHIVGVVESLIGQPRFEEVLAARRRMPIQTLIARYTVPVRREGTRLTVSLRQRTRGA